MYLHCGELSDQFCSICLNLGRECNSSPFILQLLSAVMVSVNASKPVIVLSV